jgi:sucrose phosphorylase
VVTAKTLAAHSILLAFLGVPAIYYHSLFGSGPDHEGMRSTGINRRINRAVLDADDLVDGLHHHPRRKAIFAGLAAMLETRRSQPAFSPYGTQDVVESDPRVLVLRRGAGTTDEIVCVTNVTGEPVELPGISGTDVITGKEHWPLRLPAFGYAWVRPEAVGDR